MNLNTSINKVTTFLNKITKLLIPLVAVSLLLGIIFGPTTPFVGDVYKNVTDILQMLGEDALLALVSILIIALYLKLTLPGTKKCESSRLNHVWWYRIIGIGRI